MNEEKSRIKILIVEDTISIRDIIRNILETEGYQVLLAENGKAGIEIAKTENPDLVITDIMMPEVDGYHMIFHLINNEYLPKLPVFLIITVRSKEFDKGLSERLGVVRYLTKPFRREELIKAVDEIFAR